MLISLIKLLLDFAIVEELILEILQFKSKGDL